MKTQNLLNANAKCCCFFLRYLRMTCQKCFKFSEASWVLRHYCDCVLKPTTYMTCQIWANLLPQTFLFLVHYIFCTFDPLNVYMKQILNLKKLPLTMSDATRLANFNLPHLEIIFFQLFNKFALAKLARK